MIDNQDKQTQPLDLGAEPKRPGRPAKQNALSNAERQRLYRERQKAQRNEIERELHNAYATSRVDEAYSEDIWQELEQAKARIIELEAQLAQRNENANSEAVERLTKNFRQVYGQMERLRIEAVEKEMKIAQLKHQIEQLQKELARKTRKKSRPEAAPIVRTRLNVT